MKAGSPWVTELRSRALMEAWYETAPGTNKEHFPFVDGFRQLGLAAKRRDGVDTTTQRHRNVPVW
jgi:hypothetical protein